GGSCMPITPPSARTLTSTPVLPRGRRGTRFASPIAPRASSPSPATERAPTTLTNSRLFMVLASDRRDVGVLTAPDSARPRPDPGMIGPSGGASPQDSQLYPARAEVRRSLE